MSNEAKKHESHLARLTVLMLAGVFGGTVLSGGPGDRFDFWHYAAPYAQSLVGALLGLAIDLSLRVVDALVGPRRTHVPIEAEPYARQKDNRVSREFLLAVIICVVLAIAWARVH
jgi:hypothetical protein